MLTVTPSTQYENDLLATGLPMLILLVALAIVLFQALRVVLTALLGLLHPALVLFRSLLLVVGLVAVVGYGLVSEPPEPEPPSRSPATPTATKSRPQTRATPDR